MKYEPVIGLEIHIEYQTKTKMFCRCSADYFGSEPNTSVCPVCLGLPGALPVTNEQAIEHAVKVGLSLHCEINKFNKFDRKHYFYPDLPKGYQISQYDFPINGMGYVDVTVDGQTDRIGITRAHQEEDAGKLVHGSDGSFVDLNRSGVPLLEIVSEPEIKNPQQAKAYAQTIQQIVRYCGVSSADMEKGSMRCDANISLRPAGQTTLPNYKVEVKNMNTFKGIERALEYEMKRQTEMFEKGEKIIQETRGWDENRGRTVSQRAKEEANDYRYFPEPDLPPLRLTDEYIEKIRRSLPELPDQKNERFKRIYKFDDKVTSLLIQDRQLADWFEEAVNVYTQAQEQKETTAEIAKTIANWMTGELLRRLNETRTSVDNLQITPAMLAELLYLLDCGKISGTIAKAVFAEMFTTGATAVQIVKDKDLGQISNTSEIEAVVKKVIDANLKAVADYKVGKENSLMFLIGQVMHETHGKAKADAVKALLIKNMNI